MNHSIEQYLRCFAYTQPSTWFTYLALAEWSYNTSVHSSTNLTPYGVIYSKPPPAVSSYILGTTENEAVDALLSDRDTIHAKLRSRLLKAHTTMKHYADQHCREVQYDVGQLVYVKLRPYWQTSVHGHHSHKLAKCYFGPFPILERIGSVAYCLQLPLNSKLHPVFHCSLLRPHHGHLDLPVSPLPPEIIDNQPVLEPLAILSSCEDPSTSPPTRQVLVQWHGLAPKFSTWEKWDDIQHCIHLEDKVSFPRGGDVSNNHDMGHSDLGHVHEGHADDHAKLCETHNRPRRSSTRPSYLKDFV